MPLDNDGGSGGGGGGGGGGGAGAFPVIEGTSIAAWTVSVCVRVSASTIDDSKVLNININF